MNLLRPSRLAAACAVVIASGAQGQNPRLQVGPFFSGYAALGSFQTTCDPCSASFPSTPNQLNTAQWGGLIRYWASRRFGVQVDGAAGSAEHNLGITPAGPATVNSELLTASAQLLYDVSPAPEKVAIWLGLGGGVVHHDGEAFESTGVGPKTNAAGVVGAGARIPIFRSVGVDLGLNTLLYEFSTAKSGHTPSGALATNSPSFTVSGFQTDLQAHAGLSLGFF